MITPELVISDISEEIQSLFPFSSGFAAGSYATGNSLDYVSDFDFIVLTPSIPKSPELASLRLICRNILNQHSVWPDVQVITYKDNHFLHGISARHIVNIKIGSKKLWGGINPAVIPDPEFDRYLYELYDLVSIIIRSFRSNKYQNVSVNFPNKNNYYFGYIKNKESNLKPLASLYFWIATILAAELGGKFIVGKCEAVGFLENRDPKTYSIFSDSLNLLRNKWHYKIPRSQKEIEKLRSFCRNILLWEGNPPQKP